MTLQSEIGFGVEFDIAFGANRDIFIARQTDALVAEFDLVIVLIFDGDCFCLFIQTDFIFVFTICLAGRCGFDVQGRRFVVKDDAAAGAADDRPQRIGLVRALHRLGRFVLTAKQGPQNQGLARIVVEETDHHLIAHLRPEHESPAGARIGTQGPGPLQGLTRSHLGQLHLHPQFAIGIHRQGGHGGDLQTNGRGQQAGRRHLRQLPRAGKPIGAQAQAQLAAPAIAINGMGDAGHQRLAIEALSHPLDLHRVEGLEVCAAIHHGRAAQQGQAAAQQARISPGLQLVGGRWRPMQQGGSVRFHGFGKERVGLIADLQVRRLGPHRGRWLQLGAIPALHLQGCPLLDAIQLQLQLPGVIKAKVKDALRAPQRQGQGTDCAVLHADGQSEHIAAADDEIPITHIELHQFWMGDGGAGQAPHLEIGLADQLAHYLRIALVGKHARMAGPGHGDRQVPEVQLQPQTLATSRYGMAGDDALEDFLWSRATPPITKGDADPAARFEQAAITDFKATFGHIAIEQGEAGLGDAIELQLDLQVQHLQLGG